MTKSATNIYGVGRVETPPNIGPLVQQQRHTVLKAMVAYLAASSIYFFGSLSAF
jgi:hypothetical protein